MGNCYFLSDLHYHPFPEFSKITAGINSRLFDTHMVCKDHIKYAVNQGIELLVIPGDIFHTKGTLHTAATYLFKELLDEFDGEVMLLVGNHDQSGDLNALKQFKSDKVIVISKPVTINISGQRVLFIPYTKNKETINNTISNNQFDYLVGHFDVSGAKLINSDTAIQHGGVDLSNVECRGILLGHYHTPQDIPTKSGFAKYVGSPLHHSFSDEGQNKRGLIVNFKDGTTYDNYLNNYTQFKTIHDVTNLPELTESFYRVYLRKGQTFPEQVKTIAKGYRIELVQEQSEVLLHPSSNLNMNKIIKKFILNQNLPDKIDTYKALKKLMEKKDIVQLYAYFDENKA